MWTPLKFYLVDFSSIAENVRRALNVWLYFVFQLFIDPAKLLPLHRFLPKPPQPKGPKKKGPPGGVGGARGGGGRGGFGGRGGGFGGRGIFLLKIFS